MLRVDVAQQRHARRPAMPAVARRRTWPPQATSNHRQGAIHDVRTRHDRGPRSGTRSPVTPAARLRDRRRRWSRATTSSPTPIPSPCWRQARTTARHGPDAATPAIHCTCAHRPVYQPPLAVPKRRMVTGLPRVMTLCDRALGAAAVPLAGDGCCGQHVDATQAGNQSRPLLLPRSPRRTERQTGTTASLSVDLTSKRRAGQQLRDSEQLGQLKQQVMDAAS